MAVAFVLYNYNGHGRGARPRTYKGQCDSGRPENQSKFVLLLGFYRQTRLTTFGLFAVFPEKMCENSKPACRGHQRSLQNSRFSPRKRGESGNNEIIGTAWWACATWGCSWGPPGARLGASGALLKASRGPKISADPVVRALNSFPNKKTSPTPPH